MKVHVANSKGSSKTELDQDQGYLEAWHSTVILHTCQEELFQLNHYHFHSNRSL